MAYGMGSGSLGLTNVLTPRPMTSSARSGGSSSGGGNQPGYFWRGADSKVYVQGANGINSAGNWDANTANYWKSRGFTQTADSKANAPTDQNGGGDDSSNNISGGGSGSRGGGGGGGGGAAAVAYLNSQQSNLDRQMGRTGTTLEQGLTRLTNDYNSKYNTGSQNRARALEDLGIQRKDTDAAKDKSIDKVNTNARVLADSLRRKIGLASGSGSSAYQITAPGAVARDASTERGDVLGTFAQNYRSLDMADKRTKEDYEKLFADLAGQRQQGEYSLRQGVENTRNEISQRLADVAAKRAAANGGGLSQQMAASQGYEADIAARERAIDGLFGQYVKPIAMREVQAQTPELAQYLVDRAAIQANAASGTQDPYAPYSNLLKKGQDDVEMGL